MFDFCFWPFPLSSVALPPSLLAVRPRPPPKKTVLLCKMVNVIQPGLVPRINTSRAPFPEMENITAFLAACRDLGVAEHSLFDTKDLHEKRDLVLVVRCMHVLGAAVQSSVPDFRGPYLGEKKKVLFYTCLNFVVLIMITCCCGCLSFHFVCFCCVCGQVEYRHCMCCSR